LITLTLKDGIKKEIENPMSIYDIAGTISGGLQRNATAGMCDGNTVDLRYIVDKDSEVNILTFDDLEGRKAFNHTGSHILAQAVKRLYPNVKLAIGPAINDGFYYDIDRDEAFTSDEIIKIEEEMKKIVKEALEIEKFTLPRDEAIKLMADAGETYKVELIEELSEGEEVTFYKQGEFIDLCAGPHLFNTKPLKAVKILSEKGSSGAYWRGDEKNKMLNRIYGITFPKASMSEEFLKQREEALKRDHNKLGRELKFFTTSEEIGQGLPLLMPRGAKTIQLLQRFVEEEEERRGYVMTKTPLMAKSDLYKTSGHWEHYKDGMFVLGDEEVDKEVFALRPMTCPFQFTVYNAEQHSYRDLPIRYGETSTLFRNESSGEMHGLIRVRQFTISEGHIVCRPDQIKQEFKNCVELLKYMLETLGLSEGVSYRFSKWDENNKEKYQGGEEVWNSSQTILKELLDELQLDYKEESGEAAFYGPKLDVQYKNVFGKEDTIITVQLDFSLAERFGMYYIDSDKSKQYPVVIHRTSIGCYERTLALLIERFAGALPTWLAYKQAVVLPISDKYNDYAESVIEKLKDNGVRAAGDFRAEKIGYKIREARNDRTPFILVVGEQEKESGKVSVRSRLGDEGQTDVNDFIDRIVDEIKTKKIVEQSEQQ